jgi:hypothetical protein
MLRSIKLGFLCLAVSAALAAGGGNTAHSVPIALYVSFEQAAPPIVLESLQEELRSIMTPVGVPFEWRRLEQHRSGDVSAELAVIRMTGRCDAAGVLTRTHVEGSLGFTHVSDGQILPFTEVSCDRIRNFLQGELLGIDPAERETTFGRALGRVLAHELYHIFARTMRHGSGVAKESYSVRDLLGDDLQFHRRELQALKEALAPTASM